MTTETLEEARQLVAEHVEVLRGYSQRVLGEGGALSQEEESDRESRVREFFAMGTCLKLTPHEMVAQVYKDMLRPRRRCGCPRCRSSASSGPCEPPDVVP